jgi:hypothetical protein
MSKQMIGTPPANFSSVQSYTLEGLAVYTQYLVSLRVYNPEGSGPETIVVVMTDEGGKSRPHTRFIRQERTGYHYGIWYGIPLRSS